MAWVSQIIYQDLTAVIPSVYESGEDPLVLILDGISDVRNFGAIARSAECAGVHAIVVPATGSAAINADAVKTSAGALHRIPVCRHRDLRGLVTYLKESGLKVFAASEKAARSIYETDLSGPAGIILGSEELGVSERLLENSDQTISIPMKGSIASLNVSLCTIYFMISEVPEAILPNLIKRRYDSTGYLFVYPIPPSTWSAVSAIS